jgi:NAD+ kinase
MATHAPKAGIIYNDQKPAAGQAMMRLREMLQARGWNVAVTTGEAGMLEYARPDSPVCHTPIDQLVPPGFDDDIIFAVVLGGDGTVLSAFRQVAPCHIPVLAVNTGHLGFLTEILLDQLFRAIDAVLAGEYEIEDRAMMSIQVYRGGDVWWEALGLNEMVIHREPLTSLCYFEVEVGRYSRFDIAADGIIVSTPTGSTAYSLSAGGPVITPGIPVLQMIPICPHSLASRALVFSNSEPMTIFPANPGRLVLVVDGNAGCYVLPEDCVRIEKSPYPARFIRLQPAQFFNLLRNKLGWGAPHVAKPMGATSMSQQLG